MPHPFAEEAHRYARLLSESVTAPPPTFAPEPANTLWVERGVVLPLALSNFDSAEIAQVASPAVAVADPARLPFIAVVDAAGHYRPHYRPLFVYCWLQAYRLLYETLPRETFGQWDETLRPWCDALEGTLTERSAFTSEGADAAASAWSALALHVAGRVLVRDAWTDLAADAFGRIVRGQQAGGSFLAASASDNPETLWHHELIILHAAASYAVQAEDRSVAAAVARNAQYVQDEMQPDHATSQPWALFAFIWNPNTRPLADQVLHTVRMQHPQGVRGVSLMLLADALYCLQLFDRPPVG